MIKECVVLNGQIINIGPWDYQVRSVEVSPAEYDEEGNISKEAVYEDRPANPLPDGAVIEEREVEYSEEYGWREVGWTPPLTETDLLRDYVLNIDYRLILMELGIS